MRLLPVTSFRAEAGHAFLANLPDDVAPGDSSGQMEPSALRLFEGSRELGPASTPHDRIRTVGLGAFSHWGRQLYFSASDNSDPVTNGRSYFIVAPGSKQEAAMEAQRHATSIAQNSEAFQECLRTSLSTQGAELHSIYCLRVLCSALDEMHLDVAGKRVLEIGASPSKGLGLALSLLGAGRIVMNNVLPMAIDMPAAYARNIAVLTGLMTPLRRGLDDATSALGHGDLMRLNPALFELVAPQDAVDLPSHCVDMDLIVSFSVLEHIRHLSPVLGRLRQAVSPAGVCMHWIDLRDHTDMNDPLKYLRLSESEFQARYSTADNRWRRAEYLKMFSDAGWHIIDARVAGRAPTLENGNTDMFAIASRGPEGFYVADAGDLIDDMALDRDALSAEYAALPAEELAVLGLRVIARPA